MGFDWLYDSRTAECHAGSWDNTPETLLSRLLLPALLVLAAAATLASSRRPRRRLVEGAPAGSREDDEDEDPYSFGLPQTSPSFAGTPSMREVGRTVGAIIMRPRKERMWHLDYARIVCVSCIVAEHSGGETYSHHNVEFVLQWVMPFLYVTSGMCFMLSSAPLWYYLARLCLFFVVGVGANWTADVISGRDWRSQYWDTVFQMFYVVLLAALAVLTCPLRRALRWTWRNPAAPVGWKLHALTLGWGLASAVGFLFFVTGRPMFRLSEDSWWLHTRPILNSSPVILASLGGTLFLCSLACARGPSGWLGWILLAFTYVPRVAIPYASAGYPHGVDLYILGMVVERWPLKGSKLIAERLRSYWPLLLGVLMTAGTPNTTGRCDLDPANTWWERLRFYFIEFWLVLAFVCGAANSSDPLGVTRWLNWWALYAYCFHVAWFRIFRSLQPLGPLVTFGSAPLFWAALRLSGARREAAEEERDCDASLPSTRGSQEPDCA